MEELIVRVTDLSGTQGLRPVTGGVPLPEGAAPEGTCFHLRATNGDEQMLQTEVLARWKDGSARWVLLDFLADPPPHGSADYVLCCTKQEPGAKTPDMPRLSSTRDLLLDVAGRAGIDFVLTAADGTACAAVAEHIEEECVGPVRSTLALRGSFRRPSGQRVFQFRLRASVYAGLALAKLEPMILVDAEEGVVHPLRALTLHVRFRRAPSTVRLGGTPGWEGAPREAVRLFQRDDARYIIQGL
ncbi:MAG: hypothetical protein QHJ73_00435, partial [Armatimonadota bacterium]|nr:hypothetical protein [Armatimonadota bacterium]